MNHTFFESIKIVNGIVQNQELHIARWNATLQQYFPQANKIEKLPIENIPLEYQTGIVKCKIVYAAEVVSIHFSHYQKQPITDFKIAANNAICYAFKNADRRDFIKHASLVPATTEVIIAKHGMLTDATYSNICLWNGTQWHTPKYPLLKGTMRAYLLAQNKIVEKVILLEDVHLYSKISFINAMNTLEERQIAITNF